MFVCLSVCVFVCLSDLTHEKVKGFPLVSFVMTCDEVSDFRQKKIGFVKVTIVLSSNIYRKCYIPHNITSSESKFCIIYYFKIDIS